MSSLAFVTHPSVRIKGTENAYVPSQCMDELCPVKAPHLHCPFCVKTDAYQDPVILKAHYRVKHVDKGIDFAGLKILRCCDQCDIIGIIKGEKRFKGAHWHCYRCRNGFNRRDEAIKHYKTHFRNPQTTFQIQITQDLNSPPVIRQTSAEEQPPSTQDTFATVENPVQEIIHPSLSQTVSLEVTDQITGLDRDGSKVHKLKVKPEPIEKDLCSNDQEDQQTIMIIQGDQLESAFASQLLNSGELSMLNKGSVESSLSWEIRFRMEEEEKNMYKTKVQEYKNQLEVLQQQVRELEAQLGHQMSLRLQEIISALSNSEGDAHKQTLGLQLAKVLEQFPAQTAALSTPISSLTQEINPQQAIIAPPPTAHVVPTSHIDSNGLVASALEHATAPVMTPLGEIPHGYQVISTTPEGHLVLGKSSDYHEKDNTVVLSSGDMLGKAEALTSISSDKHSILPTTDVDPSSHDSTAAPQTIQSAISENLQDAALSASIQANSASSMLNREMQPGMEEHLATMASEEASTLLHVVTAADGLASLGTDLPRDTFVMDIGQGLLVHKEDKGPGQLPQQHPSPEPAGPEQEDNKGNQLPCGEPPEKKTRPVT